MPNEWRYLVHKRKANICVLDMPILDTSNKTNGLIGEVVAEIVLQLLSFIAEKERRNIHERQRQGIAAAKARGVRFGRPRWEPTAAFIVAAEAAKRGELPWSKAAHDCSMRESNFRYHAKTLTPLAKRNGFRYTANIRSKSTLFLRIQPQGRATCGIIRANS